MPDRRAVAGAVLFVVVWIAGVYAWDAIRTRFFPQLPPLGDIG